MARDKTPPPPSPPTKHVGFTASARRVDLTDGKRAARVLRKRTDAQGDAWDMFDALSEVSFPTIWIGALMQKVRFYAACYDAKGNIVHVDSETSPLLGSALAAQAKMEMGRLVSERGSQGELNKVGSMNLEVAGEFVLWGRPADPLATPPIEERWDVLSVREIEPKQASEGSPATYLVKRDPEDPGTETSPEDALIRIWQRHPAWGNRAMSAVLSTLMDCDTLLTLSQEIQAQSKSRQGAGLFKVPSELGLKINQGSAEPDDDSPQSFDEQLAEALTTPIENPSDASSVVPMIVSGPGQYLTPDMFGPVSLGRTTDEGTDARMEKLTVRIARGLHMPVEVLLGHMNTTFANAEQIGRDKFDEYLDPRCRTLAEAYSQGFLWPQLRQAIELGAAIDPSTLTQVFVWYDASAIIGSPDPTADADELHANGIIGDAAYRRLKGIDEADAATVEEKALAIGIRKGALNGEQTATLFRMGGIPIPEPPLPPEPTPAVEPVQPTQPDVNASIAALLGYVVQRLDAVVAAAPVPQRAPVLEAVVAAPRATAVDGLGRRLVDVERTLRSRVLGACDQAMERMLERAGARLRSKRAPATSALPAAVPNRAVAMALGPTRVKELGFTEQELTAGAWDALHAPFVDWCVGAALQAYDAIARNAVRPLPSTRRTSYEAQARHHAEEAWAQLVAVLDDAAARLLYAADSQSRVPIGPVRRALRTAGGWTGKHMAVTASADDDGDDWDAPGKLDGARVSSSSAPTQPVGELALGESAQDLLDEAGLAMGGFTWVYGPADRPRPFEPHEELDGTDFANFDDDVLSIDGDWPDTGFYYPGDHDGCLCDFEPSVVEAPPAASSRASSTSTPLASEPERERPEQPRDEWGRPVMTVRGADAPPDDQWRKLRDRYVGNDDATLKMNRALREGRASKTAEAMDTLIKTSRLYDDMTLYRGMALTADQAGLLTEGATFTDLGFASTAISESTARFYVGERIVDAGGRGLVPTILRIAAPAGYPAADLGGEVVLQRGTAYAIEAVRQLDDVLEVTVRIV